MTNVELKLLKSVIWQKKVKKKNLRLKADSNEKLFGKKLYFFSYK
jgi:hypothetical protein